MKNKLLILLLLSWISSCSILPDWAGGDDEESYGEKHKRISILSNEKLLKVNEGLKNLVVKVPEPKYSNKWYRSSGVHSLFSENIKLGKLNKKQSVSIGKGVKKRDKYNIKPVIAEDKIFTIDVEGVVSAFLSTNIDKKIWEYEIEIDEEYADFLSGGMTYENGKLYVTTGFNKVLAINAKTGKVIWQRSINAISRSAPAVKSDVVIVSTAQNIIYALNAKTGSIKWNHSGAVEEISTYGTSSPVIYDNIVLASYSSGEIYALNIKNGAVIWFDLILNQSRTSLSFISDIDSTPLIVGNRIFLLSSQGVLVSYDIYSGSRYWVSEVGKSRDLWFSGGYIFLVNSESKALAVNASNGLIKWIVQLPKYKKPKKEKGKYFWNGPVMANSLLHFVGAHGEMVSLLPQDGLEKKRMDIEKKVNHMPVFSHDSLYYINSKGKLYRHFGSKL